MQKSLTLSLAAAALMAQCVSAQTVTNLIASWEGTTQGWAPDGVIWTNGGFSSTTGVTQGSQSLVLADTASPNYSFAFGGTASAALTADLANAVAVELDVYTPPGSFGYFQQWDLDLNSTALGGYVSTDSYGFSQSPTIGSESTLTFTIPTSMQAELAANPTDTTAIDFQIGGGGGAGGVMYLDNLRIIDTTVPEPSTLTFFGLGALGLFMFVRRRLC